MNRSSGNVLFLILIAVALFAALSYAVTQSSRSGSGSAESEKTNLQLSAKLQYLTQLRSTIQRLRLSNGCADTEISFRAPGAVGPGWSLAVFGPTVTVANAKCNVFEKEGGGMVRPLITPSQINTYSGIKGIGSNKSDLVWVETNDTVQSMCEQLFKQMYKEALPSGVFNVHPTMLSTNIGTFSDLGELSDPSIDNRPIGCFNNEDYAGWTFYYVLMER